MFPLDCAFCDHKNPAAAKFCNECGSPLYLAPCRRCGAINNMNDTECQRCGALLLRRGAPAQPVDPEEALDEVEPDRAVLEQELGAIEQGLRELRQESGGLSLPDAAPPRIEQVLREPRQGPGDSRFPDDAPPRLRKGVDALRDRWQELAAIAVFVAAVAGGGYLYYWIGASPAREAPVSTPDPSRIDVPAEPRLTSDAPDTVAPIPAPVTPPPPPADAPKESPSAGDAEAPAAVVAPSAAPEARCPPAVAAMALCESITNANRP